MLTTHHAASTIHPGRMLAWAIVVALIASSLVVAVHGSRTAAMVLVVAAAAAMFATVGAYAERLQSFSLGLFLFAATIAADIPFTQQAVTGGTRPGVVIWISDLALVVLLTLLFIRWAIRMDGPRIPRAPTARTLVIILVSFIAWEIVSALGAIQVRYAVFQVTRDVLALPILLVVLATVRTVRDVRFVCLVLLAALGFHLVLAIAQLIHGGPFGLSYLGELHQINARTDILRRYTGEALTLGPLTLTRHFSGLVGGAYLLAAVTILILPLAFATMLVERRHLGLVVLSAVGIGMALLSQSRGAWGGLLIMILSFAWLLSRKKTDRGYSSWKILAGTLVLVALVAVPLFTFIRTRLLETNLSETAFFRMELIRTGLRMMTHPFRG
ncbi:MAG: hypothetical protein HKM89_12525, partial [Gemmatimonadales bacterium]|nr:hypothetical protein [Gemmatimonadales bacterium]